MSNSNSPNWRKMTKKDKRFYNWKKSYNPPRNKAQLNKHGGKNESKRYSRSSQAER